MLKKTLSLYPFVLSAINIVSSKKPDVEIIEEITTTTPLNNLESDEADNTVDKNNKIKRKVSPFTEIFKIVRAERIALTPNPNVPIMEEQWDIVSNEEDMKTYLQWEPGILYGAAKIPVDKDLVVSLNTNGSWLDGQSIEIRFKQTEKGLKHEIKMLNLSDQKELTWAKENFLSNIVEPVGSKENDFYHVRFKMYDCLCKIVRGSELNIRFDLIDPQTEDSNAYSSRILQNVKLVTEREKNLPHGYSWNTSYGNHRHVPIGEYITMKFNTKRPKDELLERVQLTPRGWNADKLTFVNQPYPEFNRQDKASFSYTTLVPKKTTLGYKVLSTTLNKDNENVGVIESSFNVSSPITFDFKFQKDLKYNKKAQIVKGTLKMSSVTNYKILGGRLILNVPTQWRILEGEVTTFALHARNFSRIVNVEIVIPGNTEGVYPLNFKVTTADYIPVDYTAHIIVKK